MKDKACANIEAAKLLIENSYYDSAASRAYYSAYLIAWHFLDIMGVNPSRKSPDGSYYWPHHSFPKTLFDMNIIGISQVEKFEILYQRRVKADYFQEELEIDEVKESLIIAYEFINFFKNEERVIE